MFRNFLILLIIFSLGFSFGHSYFTKKGTNVNTQTIEKNTPQAFISEVYDKILENYWDKLSQTQLLEMFKLSFDKNGGDTYLSKFKTKDDLIKAVQDTTKTLDEENKNKFTSNLASSVLSSLNPNNRSGLYTQKMEQQLKDIVENRNAQTGQVEPTIFTKVINSSNLYLQFKKFSPTSYDEFLKAFDQYKDNQNISTLIFDLRGNVGGAMDATPYFLGNFLGKGVTAFEFYHQGEYLPFKTQTEKLSSILKYKQVVVLVDNQTQSSAELLSASFKKYGKGIILGTPTKGWGTVEKVFPLDNQFVKDQKYSLFLVHSLTLRDDNLPIEGRGVEPDININTDNWEDKLYLHFRNPGLTNAIKTIL